MAVTCSATRHAAPPTAPAPARPALASVAESAPASSGSSEAPEAKTELIEPQPPVESMPERGGPLAKLARALDRLQKRELGRHVRILWLGDSHAAADFWTGAFRSGLQKKFGSGGPGYVYAGYKGYRHDRVDIEIEGKWAMRPKGPATTKPQGDGAFGLGGVLLRGYADGPRVRMRLSDASLVGEVQIDVCAKLARGDEVEVTIDDGELRRTTMRATSEGGPTIRHTELRAKPGATITLTPSAGKPELCGVVVENDPKAAPGVVVDMLGINGARYGTALAWNEEAWAAEVTRRTPDLVILEYGTNEASDIDVKPAAVARNLSRLVSRVRRAAPDADCAVVAPTDRADREEVIGPLRDAVREGAVAAGCWFFDAYAAMGGRGAMRKWRDEDPPRGAKDGIHLTAKGYRDLGDKMLSEILRHLP